MKPIQNTLFIYVTVIVGNQSLLVIHSHNNIAGVQYYKNTSIGQLN